MMKNSNNDFYVYSFYRFIKIKNKKNIKNSIDNFLHEKRLRGTILIAAEGINGSISGEYIDLCDVIKFLKKKLGIRKIVIKSQKVHFLPFNKIKVRLKKEIVSLGKGEVNVNKFTGKYVHPLEWNSLVKNKNVKLIDTRNIYEVKIGKFKNAIDPKTNTFRQFPKAINEMNIKKNDKLALYCTGGIRCEKASAYLKMKGFKNIFQLEGGILNYLHYFSNKGNESFWTGECFVFDNRVAVNKDLNIGRYQQCHGCRHPITKTDMKLKSYKKGISCKYCFSNRNTNQKKRSETRQRQIDHAEKYKKQHPFKKIYAL